MATGLNVSSAGVVFARPSTGAMPGTIRVRRYLDDGRVAYGLSFRRTLAQPTTPSAIRSYVNERRADNSGVGSSA